MRNTEKLSPGSLLIWWGVLAAGAVLLMTGITHESLWFDEAYTGALVKRSMADIIRITGRDNHPPLYYLALRAFTRVAGNTVFSLRAFSVLGALLLAALGIGPVRRALGNRAGFIYTILSLIAPIAVSMAQEARMYTWAAFLVTGCALYAYFSLLANRTKDWLLFGAFGLAAAYTHYYALLAVAVVSAFVFAAMAIKKKRLLPFLYVASAALLAYLPWLVSLSGAVGRVKESYWIPPVTGEVIQKVFTYPFNSKFSIPAVPGLPETGFLAAAALMARGIILQAEKRDRSAIMAVIALGTYLLTILTGIAASWLIRPVLVERYMVPVLGLFVMALSYGLADPGKNAAPAVLAGVLILAVSGVQIHHTLSSRFNGPMREAVQTLQVQPEDIFLHTDEHTIGTFSYYYPDNMNYYYVGEGTGGYSNFEAFRPNGVLVRSLDEVPRGQRVWLVYRPRGLDPTSAPSWVRTGKLASQGAPAVFRLPLSWYDFMVYKAGFPEMGLANALPSPSVAGELTVRMGGFRNDSGKAVVLLFSGSMEGAPDRSGVSTIIGGKAEVRFENLPYADYAVIAFQDGNGNLDVDLSKGVPTEALGYSNRPSRPEGRPEFNQCRFPLLSEKFSVDVSVFTYD